MIVVGSVAVASIQVMRVRWTYRRSSVLDARNWCDVGLNCPKNRENGKGKKGFSKGVQKGDRFEKGKSRGKSSKGSGSKGKSGKGFGKKGKLNEVSWNDEDSWWYDNEWSPYEHDWSWSVDQVGWNEGFYDNDWTWHEGSNWNETDVWNEAHGSEETEKHGDDEKHCSTAVGSLTLHAIFHEGFCEDEFSHVGSLCLQPFGRGEDVVRRIASKMVR